MSKDKIREIVEGSSWYEEGEWGVRDAIRDTLVNAIYQATRLDSNKMENLRLEVLSISSLNIDGTSKMLIDRIIRRQDELTKEGWGYEDRNTRFIWWI